MPRERRRDPTTSLWAFVAHRMRRDRERAGLTQEQVAPHLNISPKLYGHYETCYRVPSLDACQKLDMLYELDQFYEGLHPHVVREAEALSELPEYTEEEAQADSIWIYQPTVIDSLFQTEEYARNIILAGLGAEFVDEVVKRRQKRQETLERENPPYIIALIRESALREMVGDPEVMRRQYDRLLELASRLRVAVQIIPTGVPANLAGAMTILGFEEGGDVAYVDAAGGLGRMIGGAATVHRLRIAFDQVRSHALSASESADLIQKLREDL